MIGNFLQLVERHELRDVLNTHFSFPEEDYPKTIVHSLFVKNWHVGYVASTLNHPAVGAHLYVYDKYRDRENLSGVTDIFQGQYADTFRTMGYNLVITNCALDDYHTKNFLEQAGFSVQEIVLAQYPL